MEICINMDKRYNNNNDNSLSDPSRTNPIINVKSIITILKHPLITLKIIGAIIFATTLFLITLIAVRIKDKEFFKKLKGKK